VFKPAIDPESTAPSVVVTRPKPGKRYLKNGPQPQDIVFAWNRFNIEPEENLRLVIAEDRNFTRIARETTAFDTAVLPCDAGLWYWRLSYRGTPLANGRITVTDVSGPVLFRPATGSVVRYQNVQPDMYFHWSEVAGASYYLLEAGETQELFDPRVEKRVYGTSFVSSSFGQGTWFWRVHPVFSPDYEGSAGFSSVAFFSIEQSDIPAEEEEPDAGHFTPVKLFSLTLESPAAEAALPGLTALRQQTEFRWSTDEELGKSRFILSRDSDPSRAPAVEIPNPGRTVRLDRLEEGVWYWTVEAWTPDGTLIDARMPRQLRLLPIPLLPEAGNRRPSGGHRIAANELRELWGQGGLVFSWSAVNGANAYIFTLSQKTNNGRRQIIHTDPLNQTRWILNDISLLDAGTFFWQVEAVNRGRNGTVEQRGQIVENDFYVDVPVIDIEKEAGKVEVLDDE
jgi:hypothetical protein